MTYSSSSSSPLPSSSSSCSSTGADNNLFGSGGPFFGDDGGGNTTNTMMIPSPSSSTIAAADAATANFSTPTTAAATLTNNRSNKVGGGGGTPGLVIVPHRGSLCRIDGPNTSESTYILEILLDGSESEEDEHRQQHHELVFPRKDFDFCLRLFAIMDTESRGQISKSTVQEFVTLRCPVFFRRDEDVLDGLRDAASSGKKGSPSFSSSSSLSSMGNIVSPTFEEIWRAVAACSVGARIDNTKDGIHSQNVEIGVEGWMVMCRFIAVAQYLEAKRRFSGRHLQQTMRHRNAPRGSELVMVDVPPPSHPTPLTATELAKYEQENRKCLPLPELDLDHSLVAAHDVLRRRRRRHFRVCGRTDGTSGQGHVKIDLFGFSPLMMGTSSSSSNSQNSLEFCLTYVRRAESDSITDTISVRRSMKDMKWLNETFVSQKALGGTLCGRILPPFPGNRALVSSSSRDNDSSSASGAIAAAANAGVEIANAGVGIATASVGMLKDGFKSLLGGYLSTSSSQPKSSMMQNSDKTVGSKLTNHTNTVYAYYNPNSPATKGRHLERYLNYMLEHPALSTSFSLQAILKVRS
jgi:hypothetical protein